MAPEYAPELVIFDSRFDDDSLKGDLYYIEVPMGRLRVRWDAEREPENFQPVGGGVAHVLKTDQLQVLPVSRDSIPDNLGGLCYRWSEGLNLGIPSVMFVLILPSHHTLAAAEPAPARAKVFKDRLALYWILKPDDLGRTQVICTLATFEGSASSKLIKLNRLCSGVYAPPYSSIEIERSDSVASHVSAASALATWQEKLAFLLSQEASVADPEQKFSIKKLIDEARKRIQELGG